MTTITLSTTLTSRPIIGNGGGGGIPPANTVLPIITGTGVVGQTLSCSTGTWAGTLPITYTYQWLRGVSNIAGATSSTYTLVQADATFVITCQVTATNIAGSASVTSSNSLVIDDADAQAFITAANITDTTQQNAINTLVVDLKGYGVWTKMKAIYPFVGGTATSHSYNLVNPTQYQITWFGGVTHNSNGITGNGTNGYGNTFLNNNVMAQNSNHISVYSRTNSQEDKTAIGAFTGGAGTIMEIRNLAGNIYFLNNGFAFQNTVSDSLGLFLNNRNNNTQVLFQKNANQIIKLSNVSSYISTSFKLLRLGENSSNYSARNYAFSSIGDGLTSQEALDLYTSIQNYQTTLGRQV